MGEAVRSLDAVDEAETVRLPAELVRVPSVTGNGQQSAVTEAISLSGNSR